MKTPRGFTLPLEDAGEEFRRVTQLLATAMWSLWRLAASSSPSLRAFLVIFSPTAIKHYWPRNPRSVRFAESSRFFDSPCEPIDHSRAKVPREYRSGDSGHCRSLSWHGSCRRIFWPLEERYRRSQSAQTDAHRVGIGQRVVKTGQTNDPESFTRLHSPAQWDAEPHGSSCSLRSVLSA